MESKPYHQENLREKLTDTGIQLINAQGIGALSIRKVAALCQVSHSAPYRHFENKQAFLTAIKTHVEEQFLCHLQKALDQTKEEEHPMLPFGKAYVAFFIAHPQYYTFFTRQEDIYFHFHPDFNQIQSNYRPFLLFKDQALAYYQSISLNKGQYTAALISQWARVHGLAGIATLEGIQYAGSWEEMAEFVLKGVYNHE